VTEVSFPVALVGGAIVVIAPEEIDVTNAAVLRATLEAARRGNETLVVDMSPDAVLRLVRC
jgi:anti-anti-sigma regulatory factor